MKRVDFNQQAVGRSLSRSINQSVIKNILTTSFVHPHSSGDRERLPGGGDVPNSIVEDGRSQIPFRQKFYAGAGPQDVERRYSGHHEGIERKGILRQKQGENLR